MNISTADLRKALQVLGLATSTKSSLPPATRLIELVTEDGFLYGYTFNKVCYLKYKICPSTEDICVNVDFNLLFSLVKGVDYNGGKQEIRSCPTRSCIKCIDHINRFSRCREIASATLKHHLHASLVEHCKDI